MSLQEYLADPVAHAAKWQVYDNTQLLATFPGGNEVPIQDADISKYHPLLVSSLRANISWSKSIGVFHVHKALAKATLAFLKSGGLFITGVNNQDYIFSQLFDIYDTNEPHTTELYGSAVELRHSIVNKESIPFVTATGLAKVVTNKDFLDATFPGWLTKWQIGNELGLHRVELLSQIFSTTFQQQENTLRDASDITFD